MTVYDAGIMCSGHFGQLGFLHAMMGSDDAGKSREEGQGATRAKILAWAGFTYRVAVGDLPAERNFCLSVSERDKRVEPEGTSKSVLAGPFDDGAGCAGPGAQWSIGDFFSFSCANPTSGRPCDRIVDPDGSVARRGAMGSLLHMIQDSYAQGHVSRLGDQPNRDGKGRMIAMIACAAPTAFHYYDDANRKDGHARADKFPRIDTSCGRSEIDDPVSAGATILWMVRKHTSPENFMEYLRTRVFPGP